MAPFDREAALKTAEKALRQGRIDAAIAEYRKIIEAQPRDWNSANALGDLYVRSSQPDKGVAQFRRIADHLATEGFYPKAAALYKKILKVRPADEPALLQSAELAAKQGLLADAKNFFRTITEGRRKRGDARGAAEITIRLGTLDPDDLEARLQAARAAAEIGEVETAFEQYREVAAKFEELGETPEALAALQQAYNLAPSDAEVRGRLLHGYLDAGEVARARTVAAGPNELKLVAEALERAGQTDAWLNVLAEVARLDADDLPVRVALATTYVGLGDLAQARNYLDARTAGNDGALWLMLAEIELATGTLEQGRAALQRALKLDAETQPAVVDLACRLAATAPEAGYVCADVAAEHAAARRDFPAAAAALQAYVTQAPGHLVALMRLVEVCVDGRLEDMMHRAQAQLAEAYLAVGRGLEARIISEDLVAREPFKQENIDRFRRALLLLGETDPDTIIAERLSGDSPFLATDELDLNEGVFFDDEPAEGDAGGLEVVALDGDDQPSSRSSARAAETDEWPAAEAGAAVAVSPGHGLDEAFREIRDEVALSTPDDGAAEQYALALTYKDLGMMDDAVHALQAAARSTRQRFDAASLLGRWYLDQDDTARAIEWFERAAEAPAPTADAGRALLYDLATTLEQTGQQARALAVLVELEAESRGYRDVARRIGRLSKAQAKKG